MFKTKNTGTGYGIRGTRGMGEYYILGNVAKHSGEFCETFQGMSSNIPGNFTKQFGESPQTYFWYWCHSSMELYYEQE